VDEAGGGTHGASGGQMIAHFGRTLRKKLYPPKRGLTLTPWRMGYHDGYSERGGECGRQWERAWIMTFKHSKWFRRGVYLGCAATVRLNGDGLEVRGRTFDMNGWPPVHCKWSNENGVTISKWPHPQGWKWTGVMRLRPTKPEYMATLEREMGRQRRQIDEILREAMAKAGWAT